MTPSDHDQWLALTVEEALEPDLPICDTHHHLWHDRNGRRYLLDEFLADTRSGHNVTSTVYMDCGSMYRGSGPQEMRPVGEVEFANGVAAMCASGDLGPTRVAAAIVGYANLSLGAAAGDVLEAQIAHAPDRFRGIRYSTALDPDPVITNRLGGSSSRPIPPWDVFESPNFREGFTALSRLGLSFDAWLYHTQIPLLCKLASDFPNTQIIMNHQGGRMGLGAYAGRQDEVFAEWSANVTELAKRENVAMKLGGSMLLGGEKWNERDKPVSSEEFAEIRKPYLMHCIEQFGPNRCTFESNFPVDNAVFGYGVLWNAYKRVAADFSPSEKAALFHDTAVRVYRVNED